MVEPGSEADLISGSEVHTPNHYPTDSWFQQTYIFFLVVAYYSITRAFLNPKYSKYVFVVIKTIHPSWGVWVAQSVE